MGKFDGKVALVTGAAGGIGRASARAFAHENARVVVVDVNSVGGEETVSLIAADGGEATFVHADVSQSAQVQAMIAETIRLYDRLDYAHNNAGVPSGNFPVADFPEDEWDRVVGIMLRGVFLCMKYEIPQMLAQGKGAIVNTASGAGLVGYPSQAAYVASKHGVLGLTKVGALDYGARGIRVNAVCPGTAWSPMVEVAAQDPKVLEYLTSLHPIGRIGTSEEIAAGVIWLCSDDASFVLGHALSVDGGYVIH